MEQQPHDPLNREVVVLLVLGVYGMFDIVGGEAKTQKWLTKKESQSLSIGGLLSRPVDSA